MASGLLSPLLPIGDGKDALRKMAQFLLALDNFFAATGCTAVLDVGTSPEDFFEDGFGSVWPEYCDALWVNLSDGSVWAAFNFETYLDDGPTWVLVASATATSNDLIGAVRDFAGSVVPAGYLECSGQAVSRTVYAGLFAVIGTTYGVGDGSTTFNLPDTRGRVAIDDGTGSGLTARTLGQTGGEETHTLSTAELAAHTHGVSVRPNTGTQQQPAKGTGTPTDTLTSASAGSDTPHNNMQPYIVFKKIIYAGA